MTLWSSDVGVVTDFRRRCCLPTRELDDLLAPALRAGTVDRATIMHIIIGI